MLLYPLWMIHQISPMSSRHKATRPSIRSTAGGSETLTFPGGVLSHSSQKSSKSWNVMDDHDFVLKPDGDFGVLNFWTPSDSAVLHAKQLMAQVLCRTWGWIARRQMRAQNETLSLLSVPNYARLISLW